MSEESERGAHDDPEPDAPAAAARRRRQRIEGAAVAAELAATMIGESQGFFTYSKQVIGRPHMVVPASPHAAPAGRQTIVCDRCSRVIDTPGVAIVRGRMVMHVRCDLRASA